MMPDVKEETLERLYQEDREPLRRYVNSKLRNFDEAEDVVQESFLRLGRVWSSSKILNARAFLFRTASNLVVDLKRREKVRNKNAEQLAWETNEVEDAPSADRQVSSNEWLKEFYQVVEQLPPKCRRVFLMNKVKGMSYAEIAQYLDVSKGTVEKHMSKALVHCRNKLAHSLEDKM